MSDVSDVSDVSALPASAAGSSLTHADHEKLDSLERAMLAHLPLVDQPLVHRFTPGLYVRQVTNPAGSLVTTKVHKTRHPFFVMSGRALVFEAGGAAREIVAPYIGITEPGTRRAIYAITDVVWVTVHANPDNTQDLDLIESRLIERRELADGQTSHELFKAAYEKQLEAAVDVRAELPE